MPPSKLLLALEGVRAVWEYGLGLALKQPLKHLIKEGDGHPVMVIPGLAGSDGSTAYIRSFLNDIGYDAYSWGQGRNLGPQRGLDNMLSAIVERIEEIYESTGGQQVSIIGWSLGGIYAREVAKIIPEKVRQVITLGTPFKGDTESTNATLVYEYFNKDTSHVDSKVLEKIREAPPVPFTSIFSKTDGVVHWTASIEEEGSISENIEITGASHLGLGHNPVTMYVISNRLQHTKENWKPYER